MTGTSHPEIVELERGSSSGFEAYAAVWSAVVPREPVTAGEVARSFTRTPGGLSLIARLDWNVAGCAGIVPSDIPGRTFVRPAVLPDYRRRGIGAAFVRRALALAQSNGSHRLSSAIEEGDEAGAAFAARLGFEEAFREIEVARPIAGDEVPSEPPAGVEIVPVGSRPGLVEGAYDLACVALPEMPLPEPYRVPSFERWTEEDATGAGVLKEATLVAVEGGVVVGFAGLLRRQADPNVAEHGLTAVAASARGRGIATALKRAQIAWAARAGLRELVTFTQIDNLPMQAVNRQLGYVERPAWIRLEAPLERVASRLP